MMQVLPPLHAARVHPGHMMTSHKDFKEETESPGNVGHNYPPLNYVPTSGLEPLTPRFSVVCSTV